MSGKLSLLLVLILVFFMATSNISTSASKKLPTGYSVIKISSVKWGQEPGGTKGCQGCSSWGRACNGNGGFCGRTSDQYLACQYPSAPTDCTCSGQNCRLT